MPLANVFRAAPRPVTISGGSAMSWTRREFLELASAGAASMGLAACSAPTRQQADNNSDQSTDTTTQPADNVDLGEFKSLALDTSAWKYDADNDVYYQLGLTYPPRRPTSPWRSLFPASSSRPRRRATPTHAR